MSMARSKRLECGGEGSVSLIIYCAEAVSGIVIEDSTKSTRVSNERVVPTWLRNGGVDG
jgi:hypothetical protein